MFHGKYVVFYLVAFATLKIEPKYIKTIKVQDMLVTFCLKLYSRTFDNANVFQQYNTVVRIVDYMIIRVKNDEISVNFTLFKPNNS